MKMWVKKLVFVACVALSTAYPNSKQNINVKELISTRHFSIEPSEDCDDTGVPAVTIIDNSKVWINTYLVEIRQ